MDKSQEITSKGGTAAACLSHRYSRAAQPSSAVNLSHELQNGDHTEQLEMM